MYAKINLPKTDDIRLAQDIARAINSRGHTALLAGGVVRDLLNHTPYKDVDLCVSMPVAEMKRLDPMWINAKIVPTGEQYGTITFVRGVTKVEATQCRVDFGDMNGPTDNRKEVFPTFSTDPVKGILQDVARRDLTINAMLANPYTGDVEDYVGGIEDLQAKRIRFVGNAVDRCQEDALRLLRAVRFAARYGFSLDPSIFDAAEDEVVQRRLLNLSAERVRDEFLGIMSVKSSPHAAWAMTMLMEFGVVDIWFPELMDMVDVEQNVYHSHDVWGHTLLTLEQSDPDLYCRLFALFHDLGKPETKEFVHKDYGYSFHNHPLVSGKIADQITKRLKFGAARSGDYDLNLAILYHLIERHMDAFIEGKMSRMIKRLGIHLYGKEMLDLSWRAGRADFLGRSPTWGDQEKIRGADEKLKRTYEKVAAYIKDIENPVFSTRDVVANGKDVMSLLNMPPGPDVGKVLKHLLHAVQDNITENTREELFLDIYWYWRAGNYEDYWFYRVEKE
jgi:tRNA nucleotidyltransferase (CCA-adding enzyme)